MLVRVYEAVIILNPVLSEEQIKSITIKYLDYITNNQGLIRNKEYWGLKKLAYPIYKKRTGWYCLFEFSIKSFIISKLENKLKKDERIIRFLIVKLNKHAIAYSKKRIKK